MKGIADLEELYNEQGDALYSLALELGGSKERAAELLILANDDFLDESLGLGSKESRFRFMKKQLEKHAEKHVLTYKRTTMPEDVYDRIVSGARIYIKTGGRVRSRLMTAAVVGVMLLVLAALALYAFHFVYSDEHDQLFREYYERNVSQEES
ncbi:MAG: hypothetical protein IJ746_03570 [Ruminococcus sp.]|nr:hypothetical protein [Ruminococcus sp.]